MAPSLNVEKAVGVVVSLMNSAVGIRTVATQTLHVQGGSAKLAESVITGLVAIVVGILMVIIVRRRRKEF